MNVQADCEGKSTRNMVPVGVELVPWGEGADPKLDRGSCSCPGKLNLVAKQMLRQADHCGLMKSSCRCMETFGWKRARYLVSFFLKLNKPSAMSALAAYRLCADTDEGRLRAKGGYRVRPCRCPLTAQKRTCDLVPFNGRGSA